MIADGPSVRLCLPAVLFSAALCGCATGPVVRARARLAAADVEGAVAAAGQDRAALREVSLAILSRALEEDATRDAAARGLEGAGWQARGLLDRLARSGDGVVATVAAAIRLRQGGRGFGPMLRAGLDHRSGEARAAAIAALGPQAREASFFGACLADTDDRARLACATAAGRAAGALAAAPEVRAAALHDPEPAVRVAARASLARMEQGDLLLETARATLTDGSQTVRIAAISALGRAEDRVTASALLVRVLSSDERVEAVRAAAALAAWGDPRGVSALEQALSARAVAVASAAAVAASEVGEPMRAALLGALGRREPEVRMQAAASLLRLGERERSVAALVECLPRPGFLGLQAALALAAVRPDEAADRVLAATGSRDPAERAFALQSAPRLEGGFAIARRGLADPEPRVRIAAASALLRTMR
jgi:hypothetical protein